MLFLKYCTVIKLDLNTFYLYCYLYFLTERPENVPVGRNSSKTITLIRGSPQLVLSPLFFRLLTHDCVPTHITNHVVKCAYDTTAVGLITHHLQAVSQFFQWYKSNSLLLNVRKAKEIFVDIIMCYFCRGTIESVVIGCITMCYGF